MLIAYLQIVRNNDKCKKQFANWRMKNTNKKVE